MLAKNLCGKALAVHQLPEFDLISAHVAFTQISVRVTQGAASAMQNNPANANFPLEQNMHQTLAVPRYGYVLMRGKVVALRDTRELRSSAPATVQSAPLNPEFLFTAPNNSRLAIP